MLKHTTSISLKEDEQKRYEQALKESDGEVKITYINFFRLGLYVYEAQGILCEKTKKLVRETLEAKHKK